MVYPNPLFNFQPNAAIEITIAINIHSNNNTDINNPDPPTSIDSPQLIKFHTNHGKGRPIVTSKILLPIELDTAMSPSPFLVTAMLVNKSGTDVPAARMVKPIMTLGIPTAQPNEDDHQTMK